MKERKGRHHMRVVRGTGHGYNMIGDLHTNKSWKGKRGMNEDAQEID